MDKSKGRILAATVGVLAVVVVSVIAQPTYMTAQPDFSGWSAPVNLGAVINSSFNEIGPALSKDGLSLYFNSNRPGGLGLGDIWVSRRNTVEEPWGTAVNLGPVINSTFSDILPNQSRDGHWLVVTSDRPGGRGSSDLWISYREHIHDDFAWQPPVNAGPGVNSSGFDQDGSFLENDETGIVQLFFVRNEDIYVSNLQPDGTFGSAVPVPELNSASNDRGISVRFDGLEAFFLSTRSGLGPDLWTATRRTALDPWSVPANLGALVNSVTIDQSPDIASDRETLFFASDRPGGVGGLDLYVTTRTKNRSASQTSGAPF